MLLIFGSLFMCDCLSRMASRGAKVIINWWDVNRLVGAKVTCGVQLVN